MPVSSSQTTQCGAPSTLSGPLSIVSNVGIATYGFDQPSVSCMIGARVTESLSLHLQMIGRILRPFPSPVGPRGYQDSMLRELLSLYGTPTLLVSPTGTGKSFLVSRFTSLMRAEGRTVTYLVNRRILVQDMANRLRRDGIPHGILMPPHPPSPEGVQIASVDTVLSRGLPFPPDVLILDEAHTAVTESVQGIVATAPGAWLVGMTATPVRLDGRGLGRMFARLVNGISYLDATAQGFLVPLRVFAPRGPDLSGVRDNQERAGEIMGTRKVVGDVVATWKRRGEDRRTLLFASTVAQSRAYVEAINRAGIAAAHVDADTSDAERDDIFGRLALNAPPKRDALLLDHVGNAVEHGLPEDIEGWSLEDSGVVRRRSEDNPALGIRLCEACLCAFSSLKDSCPECGAAVKRTVRQQKQIAGELEELQRARKQAAIVKKLSAYTTDQKREKYRELVRTGAARAYKPGWAKYQFFLRFGHYPGRDME